MLEQALALAQQAHRHQLDKAGKPYLDHPLRVMAQMDTEIEKIVALLHDAVEDSDLTLDDLVNAGFSMEAVAAIAAITRQPAESYPAYLQRVVANPVALRVKIADMTDNLDISRIPHPTAKDWQRLAKYEQVLPILKQYSQRGEAGQTLDEAELNLVYQDNSP